MQYVRHVGIDLLKTFSGRRIYLHLVAIFITYFIVSSGLDWWYFVHTRTPWIWTVSFPAVVLGGILPIIIPAVVLTLGYLRRSAPLKRAGALIAESVIIGSVVSSLYKAFTGRVQPDLTNTALDISHKFQFGFLKHGIFWGGPSSHTTIAFSMAVTIAALFPKHKGVLIAALVYALYIGLAVSTSIHWLSEAVAGAIIGSVIGWVVAKRVG